MVFPWLLRKGIFIFGVLKEEVALESFFCRRILITPHFFPCFRSGQHLTKDYFLSIKFWGCRVSFQGSQNIPFLGKKMGLIFCMFDIHLIMFIIKIKAIFLKNWTSKNLFPNQKMLAFPKSYLAIDIDQNPSVCLSLSHSIHFYGEKIYFLGKFPKHFYSWCCLFG